VSPLIQLLAYWVGIGSLVGTMNFEGRTITYGTFVAPGLVAIAVMHNAFYENSHGSFIRMRTQRIYEAILATPVSAGDLVAGEIAWGTTKAVIASTMVSAVLAAFGVLEWTGLLWVPAVAALGGLGFGAMGMWFAGLVPTFELFSLPVLLLLTPMYVFSGTFFPISVLPPWGRAAALALPLTHVSELLRAAFHGRMGTAHLVNFGYLAAFAGIFLLLALTAMRKRLVR
jgi:lipooligosaccharide transport system permease protein